MIKAIVYARVSGDDTQKDNRNLDGQLQMGRDYALEKGYEIVNELAESDKGASGASIDLPQLNKIRDLASQGKFDVLVVRELDRLSRKLAKQLVIEDELQGYGVEIEYVLADYEDSPEGQLSKHIRAVIAEYEREKIRERMIRGKRNKITSGSISSSRRPYGYKIVLDNPDNPKTTRSLEIIKSESIIVQQIFEWYTIGESLRSIARKLSQMAIPTMADMGQAIRKNQKMKIFGEWSPSTIHNILSNKTYIGQWQFSLTDPIIVECPPIIDKVTWDKAQEQKEINTARSKRNTKEQYLVSRRVRCFHCDYAMNAKVVRPKCNGKEYAYHYYYEQKDSLKLHNCGNKKLYKRDYIDDLVWQWIVKLMSDPDYLYEKLLDALKEQNEANSPLLNRLAITEKLIIEQENNLSDLLTNMRLVKSERAKKAIASEIESIETTLDKLELECSNLEKQIGQQQRITNEDIDNLVTLARTLHEEIGLCKDFDTKRALVDTLDVTVSLGTIDNQMIVKADCAISTEFLLDVSSAIAGYEHNEQKIILQIGYILDTKYNIVSETA